MNLDDGKVSHIYAEILTCPCCKKEWQKFMVSGLTDMDGNVFCPFCMAKKLKEFGIPVLKKKEEL